MKVKDKLQMDYEGLRDNGPINIVILGDSVSHGALNGTIDYESVYWNRLKKRLNAVRDYIPVNMICAAIAGTTADAAVPRLQTQVFCHRPDLVIVCFGLNDVNNPIERYLDSLRTIFNECAAMGTDVIFMTPNMMNTRVMDDTQPEYWDYAHKTADMQNGGRMDEYIYAAADLAKQMNVPVCDCYSKWKKLAETEDTTLLLVNRINHPIPEMHQLFADSLYEMLMAD